MNKFLKWLLAIVGVVVVLVVIASIVLPMTIDPNNYKDEISAAVYEKTGRGLVIGGDIKWSVFPTIGLELSDVTLGNPDGFDDQPMLDIGEAGMSVKFLPLLKRQIEVGEVSMSDVSVYLSRKADGKNNWDDLGSAQAGDTATPKDTGRGVDAFVVSGIEISNANVTFEDVDQITELKAFDLKASNIELGRPFDLQGGFSINLSESQLAGDVKFGGQVESSSDAKRFGINGLKLEFKGKQGVAGDAISIDAEVSANADIDFSKDQATLSDFALDLYDLAVTGDLAVSSLTEEPQFAGQLKVAEFNPKTLMRNLGIEAPLTMNEKAMTRFQADMRFTGSSDSANMRDLAVKFDESTFNGNLKLVNFDYPKLAFDFNIDTLNLDDYLPPDETAGAASAPGAAESDLSVEVFRGFTGGGDFRIGRLIVAGLTATDVTMKMSSDGKSVRFSPVNANFYGGRHEGDISIDASGARPMLVVNDGATGIRVDALLNDLAGTARLEGTADFNLKIKTDLTNSRTVFEALSGNTGMTVLNGAIVGIDVIETIGAVKSLLGKQSEYSGESDQGQKTEFAELTMSGVFEKGILSSDDLVMQSPLLHATGKGTINLVNDSIDYVLKPAILGDAAGQSLGELSGVPIPIKLTGNLYEPDIRVDVVAALAGSQKERINKKADELISKLIGGEEDAGTGDEEGGTEEKADPAATLLKGILGGKKKSDKKDDGGEGE